MTKANGAIIFRGSSLLDGAPIVVVATGLARKSTNAKTGAMIQTWIIREDIHPSIAVKAGADASVCGDCPLRPSAAALGAPRCYVRTAQAPASVWRGVTRGIYPELTPAAISALAKSRGMRIRIGSYGDPGAVPFGVWTELLSAQAARTGYTHQWRSAALQSVAMASVGSEAERVQAAALGYRTFRVLTAGDSLAPNEIACPASAEAGHRTTCADCGLCDGSRGAQDPRKSIRDPRPRADIAHGCSQCAAGYADPPFDCPVNGARRRLLTAAQASSLRRRFRAPRQAQAPSAGRRPGRRPAQRSAGRRRRPAWRHGPGAVIRNGRPCWAPHALQHASARGATLGAIAAPLAACGRAFMRSRGAGAC